MNKSTILKSIIIAHIILGVCLITTYGKNDVDDNLIDLKIDIQIY